MNKTIRLDAPKPGMGRTLSSPAGGAAPPPTQRFGPRSRRGGPAPTTVHPLADAMYWACSDLLTLASQLALGASPPSASEMRAHLSGLFASMHTRAVAGGIAPEDASDAVYAMMALFDEILVQARWPGRLEWQTSPLQFVHFHENTAGENFFRRVDVLLRQPHRAHVLLVYFLCLALGFQGRYAVSGGMGLAQVYEVIGATVSNSLPAAEPLSPHGEAPDAVRSALQRDAPIVRLAALCLLLAVLAFGGLRLFLSTQVAGAVGPMRDFAASKP